VWTAEGIGRSRQEDDPQYKSSTAQGTRSQEIRLCNSSSVTAEPRNSTKTHLSCKRENMERTDVREETLEWPGM
jgi:hypothetical protein